MAGRARATTVRSSGPLRLLVPDAPGGAVWAYQASLGGGFVGTDALRLDVEVHPGAALFLSSQASSKVFRGTDCRFELDAQVGDDAVLVSWPEPLVCFAGASLAQRQTVALAERASVLWVDSCAAGRVAQGERWAFERLSLAFGLTRAGERLLDDAVELSAEHGPLGARLGVTHAFATVVIAGPRFDALASALDASLRRAPVAPGETLTVASRKPWGLVLRVTAPSTQALEQALQAALRAPATGTLGADPWAHRH